MKSCLCDDPEPEVHGDTVWCRLCGALLSDPDGEMREIDREAKLCSVPGCERSRLALGICGKHYQQWRRDNGMVFLQAKRRRYG